MLRVPEEEPEEPEDHRSDRGPAHDVEERVEDGGRHVRGPGRVGGDHREHDREGDEGESSQEEGPEAQTGVCLLSSHRRATAGPVILRFARIDRKGWKSSKKGGKAGNRKLSSIVFRRFGDELNVFIGKPVSVITAEGKEYGGVLLGVDESLNLVLDKVSGAGEKVFKVAINGSNVRDNLAYRQALRL